MKMLGADSLALTAAYAIRRLSVSFCIYLAVIIIRVPIVVYLLGVHTGEQIRDRDMLRASVRAVAAGGAWNKLHISDYIANLFDRFDFF